MFMSSDLQITAEFEINFKKSFLLLRKSSPKEDVIFLGKADASSTGHSLGNHRAAKAKEALAPLRQKIKA